MVGAEGIPAMMIDNLPYRQVGTEDLRPGGLLCVADHASNFVPEDIELGIDRKLLTEHIAVDIGSRGSPTVWRAATQCLRISPASAGWCATCTARKMKPRSSRRPATAI